MGGHGRCGVITKVVAPIAVAHVLPPQPQQEEQGSKSQSPEKKWLQLLKKPPAYLSSPSSHQLLLAGFLLMLSTLGRAWLLSQLSLGHDQSVKKHLTDH